MIARGLLALRSTHLREIARRLGWGVGDQAVSSLSNFVLGVFVVRTLGASSFGAFSLAFLTYSVVLNASRGLSTDPLMVRYSGADAPTWRRVVASSSGTAFAVGSVAGVMCIAIGPLLPSPLDGAFIALGFGLPGLMVQDSWRFAFFAVGQGSRAMLNDVFLTVLQIAALVTLHVNGRITVTNCLLVFGATGTAAAAFGLLQTRVLPHVSGVGGWLHEHRTLGFRYLLENIAGSGAAQLRALALGAIAGLAAVGDVQAAAMFMGPFLVILMGVSQVAVPETAHVLHRGGPNQLKGFCLSLGGAQAAAAAIWGSVVLVALPHGLGELVLGPTWHAAHRLIAPMTVALVLASFSVWAGAGLRALGAAPRSLNAQLVTCALYLLGGVVGAAVAGAAGVCWAAAATELVATLFWWHHLRSAIEEFGAVSRVPGGILPAGATT